MGAVSLTSDWKIHLLMESLLKRASCGTKSIPSTNAIFLYQKSVFSNFGPSEGPAISEGLSKKIW